MNLYLLFKSLHLIAVISWMAGLLYLPRIFVYHSEATYDSQKDIFQYFREFDENKPKDVWYLEYLGVDPFKQSMGLGSALLKSSLEKIDLLHEPAYLESSNPRNMSLYERNGFQTVKKFQFGAGPPIHTMYREAR